MKKFFYLPIVVLILLAPAAGIVSAQNALTPTTPDTRVASSSSAAVTTNAPHIPPSMQTVINSLSSLPEADTVIYLNPQRILNELVPRVMPPKAVEDMRRGFEEAKKNAGIDPTKVDYIVLAVRFRKPTAELNFQAPELLLVASGDFSAESLLGLARMASQGKLRDEKYADKTMGLMTIDPIAKEAEKNPFLKAFTEVGIVSLNSNTIAAGTPGYLRAAIDAGSGKDRINAATLNFLVRDPNALVSVAAKPWQAFAKSFGMMGTEANARTPRCETGLGDFYGALTMDATNFMIRGVSNADNPDTAKIIANLYSGLLRYGLSSIKDAPTQSLLQGVAITAEGDEVLVRADFPQQMVIDMVKEKMKPKPKEMGSAPAPETKPAVKKRRPTRRRG